MKNSARQQLCDLYTRQFCRNQSGVYFVFVAIGCALGGVCRHLLAGHISGLLGDDFPWGTLVVNSLGSFLLGLMLGFGVTDWQAGEPFYGFAAIGFCGGLTTFSAFSLQALTLVSQQRWKLLAVKVFGSLLLCMSLLWTGFELGEGCGREAVPVGRVGQCLGGAGRTLVDRLAELLPAVHFRCRPSGQRHRLAADRLVGWLLGQRGAAPSPQRWHFWVTGFAVATRLSLPSGGRC